MPMTLAATKKIEQLQTTPKWTVLVGALGESLVKQLFTIHSGQSNAELLKLTDQIETSFHNDLSDEVKNFLTHSLVIITKILEGTQQAEHSHKTTVIGYEIAIHTSYQISPPTVVAMDLDKTVHQCQQYIEENRTILMQGERERDPETAPLTASLFRAVAAMPDDIKRMNTLDEILTERQALGATGLNDANTHARYGWLKTREKELVATDAKPS